MRTPRILIVAGSDSGGGAGIQADIKTVSTLGGHAMTAITAITAQNTLGVTAVHPVPTAMVIAQMDAVIDDIGVDAVKIGMIGSAATSEALADRLERLRDVPIVLDPVMVATSGATLADGAIIAAFARLMDIATVATPNAPELAALTGLAVGGPAEAVAAARLLVDRHGCSVLAKGGHFEGALVDSLVDFQGKLFDWTDERIESRSTHGTGCTLASGIAVGLAEGLLMDEAVGRARAFVRAAMMAAPGLGAGHGPMGQGLVRARPSH
ncbi:bifunctional hydroxymethylpyrimidine kinase/phosphomethylpyrimidine kinase [Flavisphingomonas formosensis]|uniref:bifunctional hydroxymethylpyrimidine kinase/phosphomethylpyrimidine kinase n=1 Tax=Flavisphingomonas formosensis TaxID=861534 RepID=UPI0012F8DE07|nr:bifunctional hydroxymethylpyrimidine kinase/phosphomethylpyrimidine kinase [Sphingomonas formosensis]